MSNTMIGKRRGKLGLDKSAENHLTQSELIGHDIKCSVHNVQVSYGLAVRILASSGPSSTCTIGTILELSVKFHSFKPDMNLMNTTAPPNPKGDFVCVRECARVCVHNLLSCGQDNFLEGNTYPISLHMSLHIILGKLYMCFVRA